MDKLLIEGGTPLKGSVRISGAKNAALPAMAAALLTSDRVELENIPRVRDIITMGRLLAHMGAIVETPAIPPTAMIIQAEEVNGAEAPYELVKTMRASILTLGPLVARTGHARVSLPGRMRDRRAAGGPASESAGADGRGNRNVPRLRGSARTARRALAGRARFLR